MVFPRIQGPLQSSMDRFLNASSGPWTAQRLETGKLPPLRHPASDDWEMFTRDLEGRPSPHSGDDPFLERNTLANIWQPGQLGEHDRPKTVSPKDTFPDLASPNSETLPNLFPTQESPSIEYARNTRPGFEVFSGSPTRPKKTPPGSITKPLSDSKAPNHTNRAKPYAKRGRTGPSKDVWEQTLKPKIKVLFMEKKMKIKDVIHVLEKEYPYRITPRMFRQRTKGWGMVRNRNEKEMRAVLRAVRLSRRQGKVGQKMRLRGESIGSQDLKEYFRKKLKPGKSLEDIPTPTASEVEDVSDVEVEEEDSNTQDVGTSSQSLRHLDEQDNETSLIPYSDHGVSSRPGTGMDRLREGLLSGKHDIYLEGRFSQEIKEISIRKEQRLPHPRRLLRAWIQEVLRDLGDQRVSETIMMTDSLIESLVIQEYGSLLLYLILLSRMVCIPSSAPQKFQRMSAARLSAWDSVMAECTFQARTSKGLDHPLTIYLQTIASSGLDQQLHLYNHLWAIASKTVAGNQGRLKQIQSDQDQINYLRGRLWTEFEPERAGVYYVEAILSTRR